ncbi:transcription factor bHLH104-like [Andrographis paniculata]|uniref:transcription factor bHLH104-like n=1 Tax=Andrographis paniculata TaxID=175694 RepID=UPI0021E98C2E|nr:transcription factor bHLH104-like [Andrographis paniculata]
MASFDDCCWPDLEDFSGLLDDVVASAAAPEDLYWTYQLQQNPYAGIDASFSVTTSQGSDNFAEKECSRKRDRGDLYGGIGAKAFRERVRREKLNDRFSKLCAVLEPGRPVKTDKIAILNDTIRILKQLKTESREYKEMNERLLEEMQNLKAEKNELRQEKLMLQADKEWIEQQLKTMKIPSTGFVPAPPQIYLPEVNKLPVFPSYGLVPMWQYIPPSVRDTSHDHMLRPPAA